MDPASLAGMGLALIAIVVSMLMEGGDPMSIILLPPIILVFVGTFGVAMASGMMKDAIGIVGLMKRAMLSPKIEGGAVIDVVVKLADRARREGLLALEDEAKKVDDPFLRKGLELAIDGTDSEEVRDILESEIDTKRKHDKVGAKIFTDMGGFAPTIGIIGTVLGLVHVLENLADPSELGHLIAGAFVATLFGVMTANVFWLPMANRLKRISELECEQMMLALEGVLAIQAGANPRLVARKLRSLVPASGEQDKAA
ncbi:flagellar motor protein [Actinokineospora cianjurensis]|uniref:Chemotaxis protein MotA n=1 Tax=Actinokineospora cianjurensis TaxID=585224 RepID=A0A421AU85_9PSEU|nr:flagellar motor protein [Actinokineospora cianjurensis]RLK53649.1 chemotaxis protein MotA [Actinokineospora cianjurensis]